MREEQRYEKEAELRRIRVLILEQVELHPQGLATFIQYNHDAHRRHVYEALRRLVEEGVLAFEGARNQRRYRVVNRLAARSMLETLRVQVAREQKLLSEWRESLFEMARKPGK